MNKSRFERPQERTQKSDATTYLSAYIRNASCNAGGLEGFVGDACHTARLASVFHG